MIFSDFLDRYADIFSSASVLSLAIALVAGLLASAVCPCTLPMGIGMASATSASESNSRNKGFLIALAFFFGIVLNLVLLGAFAGRLGAILTEQFGKYWALIMALVSIVAAVAVFLLPAIKVDQISGWRRGGIAGAFTYGFIFSLGTSAAPLLVLLAVAAAQATPLYGSLLALAFGIGRGFPFLLVGLFAGAVSRFTRIGSWRRPMQIISGIALTLVGLYYAQVFFALS